MLKRKGIEIKPGQTWTIGKITIDRMNESGPRLYRENWKQINNKVNIVKTNGTQINVKLSNDKITTIKSQNLGILLHW